MNIIIINNNHNNNNTFSNKPAAPPPSSLRFLLNQGLSLAEAKDIKEKCGKFSTTLQSNTAPVRYNRCNKGYHQKCKTGPKATFCNINWNCNKFAKILQQSSSANITQLPAFTNVIPSQQLPAQSSGKLTIIRCNANGICPKLIKPRDSSINLDTDIVAIQESKLQKADKTSAIESYTTMCKDWNNILGGCLLFFVRNNVIFEKLHSLEKAGMKILSIWVRKSKSLRVEVYNIYVLNTTTQQTLFDPTLSIHPLIP